MISTASPTSTVRMSISTVLLVCTSVCKASKTPSVSAPSVAFVQTPIGHIARSSIPRPPQQPVSNTKTSSDVCIWSTKINSDGCNRGGGWIDGYKKKKKQPPQVFFPPSFDSQTHREQMSNQRPETAETSLAATLVSVFLFFVSFVSIVVLETPEPASATTTITSIDTNGGTSIADTPAFRLLPRRRESAAVKQLIDIAELQDEMLTRCIDRGEYWEQCFFSGMRDDSKGIDYQWGSPEAALEMPQQQPLSSSSSSSPSSRQKLPTW